MPHEYSRARHLIARVPMNLDDANAPLSRRNRASPELGA